MKLIFTLPEPQHLPSYYPPPPPSAFTAPSYKCPIRYQEGSDHLYLGPTAVTEAGNSSSALTLPPVGELTFFTRPDAITFCGRIIRIIQWQRTRAIARVEHHNGLASFGLVVPYDHFYTGWRLCLLKAFASIFLRDCKEMAPGKSLSFISISTICSPLSGVTISVNDQFWEVDNAVQKLYYPDALQTVYVRFFL